MDPTTWAWIGVVVGGIGPVAAVYRSRSVATNSSGLARSTLPAVLAFLAAAMASGFVMLDGWWPWGTVSLVVGAIVTGLTSWVGARCTVATEVRAAAAITRRGDRGGGVAARDGATLVSLAVAGCGLAGVSLAYLALAHWLEVDDPAAVLAGFGLGTVATALMLRMTDVPLAIDHRRVGPSVDLVAYTVLALVAAMTIGLGGESEIGGSASVFPLGVMVVGFAASILTGLTVRLGNPVSILRRRGYLAAIATAVGGVTLALVTFDSADLARPIGMGLAVAAGVALGPALGLIGELFTSDHWRPVKRIEIGRAHV